MKLFILPQTFCICRLPPTALIPAWLNQNEFWSITKTQDELSLVCVEELVPLDVKREKGRKIIKVEGPLDFGLTGILASIATPLAQAKISIFAISTFDTDYILVKEDKMNEAQEKLTGEGFTF